MARKQRNPFIPHEQAMEMEEKTTVDKEDAKKALTRQESREKEDLIPTSDAEAAAKGPVSEERDPNQPKLPRRKK
jgi:hypothetical protein